MTFMLRDRPDGMVEIIVEKPVLIGIFPERETAERVRAFLQVEELELPTVDEPARFATASEDVAEAQAQDLSQTAQVPVARDRSAPASGRSQIVAVADVPKSPVFLKPSAPHLSQKDLDGAFMKLDAGQKLSQVAASINLSTGQMRGFWIAHKRKIQAHLQAGGKISCKLCKASFTPSASSPDTCARCNQG